MTCNSAENYFGKRLPEREAELQAILPAWCCRFFDEVSSTMDAARSIIRECSHDSPGLVIAESQIHGRGRHGNSWQEAASGLYCTLVFATDKAPEFLSSFSLAVGCVVCDLLEEFSCRACLKWPNDILSQDDKKVGGVLIELVNEPGKCWVLVGVGLNLRGSPQSVPASSSVFDISGTECSVSELAPVLAGNMYQAWCRFLKEGFAPYRAAWLSRTSLLGRQVSLRTADQTVKGKFAGISAEGFLLLEVDGEQRTFASGHLQI